MTSWLTISEVAARLKVNRKTVYDWVQNHLDREHGEEVNGLCLPGESAAGSTLLYVKEEDLEQFERDHDWDIADKQDAIEQHRGYAPSTGRPKK